VNPADLSRFIKTGELLQIEGLAQTKLPNQVVYSTYYQESTNLQIKYYMLVITQIITGLS